MLQCLHNCTLFICEIYRLETFMPAFVSVWTKGIPSPDGRYTEPSFPVPADTPRLHFQAHPYEPTPYPAVSSIPCNMRFSAPLFPSPSGSVSAPAASAAQVLCCSVKSFGIPLLFPIFYAWSTILPSLYSHSVPYLLLTRVRYSAIFSAVFSSATYGIFFSAFPLSIPSSTGRSSRCVHFPWQISKYGSTLR